MPHSHLVKGGDVLQLVLDELSAFGPKEDSNFILLFGLDDVFSTAG